jgi:hypothetical protein
MIHMRFSTLLSGVVFGATLLASPAAAHGQVTLLSNIVEEHEATAGEAYTGRMVLSNTSTTPQTMRIYQKDYMFHADGTNNDADPGTTPRSNATWVTPQATQVTVPPRSELTVPYSVKVPTSDSLKGTYWSMIYIEGAQQAPTANGANGNVGIATVIRYGVQIATHIGATGTREVKLEKPNATHDSTGNATLNIDVVNVGERAIHPKMSVEIYDANGALKGKANQARGLVYPGTSFRQVFAFGKLAPGTYKVKVFADTGDPKVQGSQYTITY